MHSQELFLSLMCCHYGPWRSSVFISVKFWGLCLDFRHIVKYDLRQRLGTDCEDKIESRTLFGIRFQHADVRLREVATQTITYSNV